MRVFKTPRAKLCGKDLFPEKDLKTIVLCTFFIYMKVPVSKPHNKQRFFLKTSLFVKEKDTTNCTRTVSLYSQPGKESFSEGRASSWGGDSFSKANTTKSTVILLL